MQVQAGRASGMRFVLTRAVAGPPDDRPFRSASPTREPLEFHRRLPGYAPTPLRDAPSLARVLDVARVLVKDESRRFGLPAFKILGASWAVYCAARERLGVPFSDWRTLDDLRGQLAPLGCLTLVTATDGNHGRAVARVAAWLGWSARVFVPRGTVPARIEAIRAEGAEVTVVDGTYDRAVAVAADLADDDHLVIADTAVSTGDPAPIRVIEGYATLFWEIEDALASLRLPNPDLVAVQVGVGALAAAAVRHFRHADLKPSQRPCLVGVEPERAACLLASVEAGHPVTLAGVQDSIMAGLNCGTPSAVAWPLVSRGIDLHVAVDDDRARQAMRALARAGIVAGESGAAGLAGLLEVLTGPPATRLRSQLGVTSASNVLLLATEGATDPQAYQRIVGHPPGELPGIERQ
ncbi:MAG TPA: diaminopropionate ammonia-lyase [Chloroflexota bacterium]